MDKGGDYDNYTGHGIDETDDPREIKIGDNLTHKIRNAEDNPEKPLDKGKATGEEGGILAAGEQNQPSDKDESSEDGNWINRTGNKLTNLATNTTPGAMIARRSINKFSAKTGVKVAGPIGTILIIILMCIGGFLGGASTMLGSFMGNLQGSLDTLDIAASTRSRYLVFGILAGKNTKGGLWGNFSSHMKKMFKNSGIEIETNADGTDVMKYNDAQGKTKTVGDYFGEIDQNTDFATKNSSGTSTYNNSTAQHHDATGIEGYKELGIDSRDRNHIEKGATQEETEQNFREDAESDLKEATPDKMTAEVEGGNESTDEKIDGDTGERITEEVVDTHRTGIEVDADTDIEGKVGQLVTAEVRDQGADFDLSIVGQAARGMCMLYSTAMTINRMIKAYEAAQVVSMAMKVFDAIQRMQAGDGGNDTFVDVVANYMTREKKTVFQLGDNETAEVESSVLSGAPVAALFGGTKVTSEDPIVKSFITSQSQFRKMADSIDPGAGYKACAVTKVAAALIDAIGDAITLGAKKVADFVVSIGVSASITLVVGAVVAVMVPKIVNALKRDALAFLEGPEGSGTMAWGGEQVIMQQAKYSAMNVGTDKTLNTYVQEKSKVIAERARIDRYNLSPFDTSSEYTFLGMIMKNLMRASTKTSSVVGNVGKITSIVNDSLVALTPASHAADAIDQIVTVGDNPEIVDLVDDGQKRLVTAFGTPYYIPDFTTMGENVEDVMWYWDAKGAFDEPYDPINNPNPTIKHGGTGVASVHNPIILAIKEGKTASNDVMLANYSDGDNLADEFVLADVTPDNDNGLALCMEEKVERGAELGAPDAAIESKYTEATTGSAFWDSALGAVPIVGGIIDLFNGIDNIAHFGNILGYKYHEDTVENHMCERYALDQRLGESMGVYDKAQTAVYIEEYRKEHPLDNSMLGIIARHSGLTKEQVTTALAQANALLFISEYNPEGLGPLFFETPKVELVFESTTDFNEIIGIVYYSSLSDWKRSQNITA